MTDQQALDELVDRTLSALNLHSREQETQIQLHSPVFRGNEWVYLKDCIDTGWVSSVGSYVDKLELDLAKFCNASAAVVVVNGTAALHLAYLLSGVQQNNEVLCPALTFVATANAILYAGAIPHFVDSQSSDYGLDPQKLRTYLTEIASFQGQSIINKRTGRRIHAVVVMHTFGHPSQIDDLAIVAKDFHLKLIEDAAESLGSWSHGRHTGTIGDIGTLSFNGNKILTTGGGGALLFKDLELAKKAKFLSTTGKRPHAWEYFHEELAFNYRMPNLNAALGCAQLEQLPLFLEKKRNLAKKYHDAFSGCQLARVLHEPPACKSNYWLNNLVLESEWGHLRDRLISRLMDIGLQARPVWRLMTELPHLRSYPQGDLSCATDLSVRTISLPSGILAAERSSL